MCQICTKNRAGLGQRFFAWAYSKSDASQHKLYGKRKEQLFKNLSGKILEIGPGTGINFNYFPTAIEWEGLEPNLAMQKYLIEEGQRKGFVTNVTCGLAERIPLADASVDNVVSTLVLCSVLSQQLVISEILRILKPGGRFIFIEHVGAPKGTYTRKLQELLRPLSVCLADGCDHSRDTAKVIQHSGFKHFKIESFTTKGPLGYQIPHISGVAVK